MKRIEVKYADPIELVMEWLKMGDIPSKYESKKTLGHLTKLFNIDNVKLKELLTYLKDDVALLEVLLSTAYGHSV